MQDTQYPVAAVERTMKVQEIVMRAMSKQITWWQAAEILRWRIKSGEKPVESAAAVGIRKKRRFPQAWRAQKRKIIRTRQTHETQTNSQNRKTFSRDSFGW